jgi:two-component system phosphate regulon sensor histidine kinase PhoR
MDRVLQSQFAKDPSLPASTIQARLGEIRLLMGAGILVGAIVGTVVVAIIAGKFARPLRRMTDAASEIAAGDLERRVPSEGTLELSQLGDSMNRMARELSARLSEAREDRKTRELILEAMADGVALVDEAGVVQYLNPAAERILGRQQPSEELLTFHPLKRLANRVADEGSVIEERFEVGHPSRIIRASGLPVGGEARILIVLRDVTETTRAHAIRRDFAAAASHELKTPVASIKAGAETLIGAMLDDPAASRRFANQLLKDADRLSRIVADLLDLSRLESEMSSAQPVSLEALVREEAERIHDEAANSGLSLEFNGNGTSLVQGSSKDLSLAVRNLLENAIQYTRSPGKVTLTVEQLNGEAVVSVQDTGIGIPSKDLPRIFERFYRVDRARSRETGGTGLGLALVKHVAEQHAGRVEAESELGQGSTFRLIVPL